MDVLSKFIKEMNASASIGSAGGVASYETPLTVDKHVEGLGRSSGGRRGNTIEKKLERLKRRYKTTLDEKRKGRIKKKIEEYERHINTGIREYYILRNTNVLLENLEQLGKRVEIEKEEEKKENPLSPEEESKAREVSKEAWEKLKTRLEEEHDYVYDKIKELCVMDSYKKKIVCNIRLQTHAIERLTRYAKDCESLDYHHKSCFRKINTLANKIKRKIDFDMEKLRPGPKKPKTPSK